MGELFRFAMGGAYLNYMRVSITSKLLGEVGDKALENQRTPHTRVKGQTAVPLKFS